MILFILIFTLVFIVFIECYFGSILFRRNSLNELTMNLPSLLNFLVHPIHNKFMWYPETLCGNYPFMLFLGILLYVSVQ